MDMRPPALPPAREAFKAFPPRRGGILLPTHNRHAAALGISLYTASRPRTIRAQRAAFRFTRRFGPRLLPGSVAPWHPKVNDEVWAELLDAWRQTLGRFDSFAVYLRRQAHRTGLTILLVDTARPLAIVKIREQSAPLSTEQEALAAVRSAGVSTFHVPEPLALGECGPLTWSAQSAVFTAPHRPAFTAPVELFDEVSTALDSMTTSPAGLSAAHNDLTPWNLRTDEAGKRWLFDWEDAAPAPPGSDRAYFSVSSFALARSPIPTGLTLEGLEHWQSVVRTRPAGSPSDERLKLEILDALNVALRARHGQKVTNGEFAQTPSSKNVH